MFLTKEEIKKELKDEDCWKDLKPKEREMFLLYCTNGHEEVEAFKDVYCREDSERTVKFPGKKAAEVLAKEAFSECFEIYAEVLRDMASLKTNAHLYNQYLAMATYNALDFIDVEGNFKFQSVEEAKERLGIKAMALTGLEVTMHPRDPSITMIVPKFCDRHKAMKELARFSKFYGSEEAGGKGLGTITVDLGDAVFDKAVEDKRRKELGVV